MYACRHLRIWFKSLLDAKGAWVGVGCGLGTVTDLRMRSLRDLGTRSECICSRNTCAAFFFVVSCCIMAKENPPPADAPVTAPFVGDVKSMIKESIQELLREEPTLLTPGGDLTTQQQLPEG